MDFVCDSGTIYVANSHYLYSRWMWVLILFCLIIMYDEHAFGKNEVKIKKWNEPQMGGIKTMVVWLIEIKLKASEHI